MKNNFAVEKPSNESALVPPAVHSLGDVADDWAAVEVWMKAVEGNSRNRSKATVNTYRFHLAKLRWFCENVVGRLPSNWSMQDVEAFRDFLAKLPQFALSMGEPGSAWVFRSIVTTDSGLS